MTADRPVTTGWSGAAQGAASRGQAHAYPGIEAPQRTWAALFLDICLLCELSFTRLQITPLCSFEAICNRPS